MRIITLGLGLLAGIALLYSIEPGKPSRTAVIVLQHRALGAKLADPHLRNPDTLAGRFLGMRERQVLREIKKTVYADMDFEEARSKPDFVQRVFFHVLARTHAIDETVSAALREGASQMVILGSGYDSRAYRMHDLLRKATVFEVDFPPTQELKKLRVREVLGYVPKNVVYVPIDFMKEDLGIVPAKAGYLRDRRTVFVWEGVSFYLNESAVDTTLRFVARNSAPGSTIVFDYESERVPQGNYDDEPLKQAMARLASWGEAHTFGLPIGQARNFVERRGLMVVADLAPEELTKQYLTRKDGTVFGAEPWYFAVCIARVP